MTILSILILPKRKLQLVSIRKHKKYGTHHVISPAIALAIAIFRYFSKFHLRKSKTATLTSAGLQDAVSDCSCVYFYMDLLYMTIIVIMTRKPEKAWELYMKMETTTDSFNLLQLIANDCYRVSLNRKGVLSCESFAEL